MKHGPEGFETSRSSLSLPWAPRHPFPLESQSLKRQQLPAPEIQERLLQVAGPGPPYPRGIGMLPGSGFQVMPYPRMFPFAPHLDSHLVDSYSRPLGTTQIREISQGKGEGCVEVVWKEPRVSGRPLSCCGVIGVDHEPKISSLP